MINNDVLRSVRYMLDLSDAKLVAILALADYPVEQASVAAYLKKDEEPGYLECPDPVLGHFLDGLVIHRRGKNEQAPERAPETRLNNNVVLKKLRVAFELKEQDLHEILSAVGFPVSKPELSALFRKPGHHNFRKCGDQLLRNFLKGLTQRIRG
jgi:uncharacterized protein YehS (DUF1456 family)